MWSALSQGGGLSGSAQTTAWLWTTLPEPWLGPEKGRGGPARPGPQTGPQTGRSWPGRLAASALFIASEPLSPLGLTRPPRLAEGKPCPAPGGSPGSRTGGQRAWSPPCRVVSWEVKAARPPLGWGWGGGAFSLRGPGAAQRVSARPVSSPGGWAFALGPLLPPGGPPALPGLPPPHSALPLELAPTGLVYERARTRGTPRCPETLGWGGTLLPGPLGAA